MSTSLTNFEKLKHAVYKATARALEQAGPEIVATVRETYDKTGDLEKVQEVAKTLSTLPEAAKWRPLLVALLDTELAINHVRNGLRFLRDIPPREVFGVSPGEWIEYHLLSWSFFTYGFLEKEETLVKQLVRALKRPTDPHWKGVQDELLALVEQMRNRTARLRNPAAHGGKPGQYRGPIEGIEEQQLWEGIVLVGFTPAPSQILQSFQGFHGRWYRSLYRFSVIVLAHFNRICGRLYEAIDWSRV